MSRAQSVFFGRVICAAGPHGTATFDLPDHPVVRALCLKMLQALGDVVAQQGGLAGGQDEDAHAVCGREGDLHTGLSVAVAADGAQALDSGDGGLADELHALDLLRLLSIGPRVAGGRQ